MPQNKRVSTGSKAFSIDEALKRIYQLKQEIFIFLSNLHPRVRLDRYRADLQEMVNKVLAEYGCAPCDLCELEHPDQADQPSFLRIRGQNYVIDPKPIGRGANGAVYRVYLESDPSKQFAFKARQIPFSYLTKQASRSRLSSSESPLGSLNPSLSTTLQNSGETFTTTESPTISHTPLTLTLHLHSDHHPKKPGFPRVSYHAKAAPAAESSRKDNIARFADQLGNGIFEYMMSSRFPEAILPPFALVIVDGFPSRTAQGVSSLGILTPLANGGAMDEHLATLRHPEWSDASGETIVDDPLSSKLLEKMGEFNPLTSPHTLPSYKRVAQWASIFRQNCDFLIIKAIKDLYRRGISFRDLKLENMVLELGINPQTKKLEVKIKLIDSEACDHLGEVAKFGGSFMTAPIEVAAGLLTKTVSGHTLRQRLSSESIGDLQNDLLQTTGKVTGEEVGIFSLGAVLYHQHHSHSVYFDKGEDPHNTPNWQASYARNLHQRLHGTHLPSGEDDCPLYITRMMASPEERVAWFRKFILENGDLSQDDVDSRDLQELDALAAAHSAMAEIPKDISAAFMEIFTVHKPVVPAPVLSPPGTECLGIGTSMPGASEATPPPFPLGHRHVTVRRVTSTGHLRAIPEATADASESTSVDHPNGPLSSRINSPPIDDL